MASEAGISVEVCYARADTQAVVALKLAPGATAGDAVRRSGLAQRFPELDGTQPLGVYGKRVAEDHPLKEGDRVEIYRLLTMDPKEARRRRAMKAKKG